MSVGDGALDQGVEVAVGGLASVKAVAGRDLGGAHCPPLPDGIRRLADVHHLGGIGHHRIDALLSGWRRGQGEGGEWSGAILIEFEVSGVVQTQVGVIQERCAVWAAAQVNNASQGEVISTDLHGVRVSYVSGLETDCALGISDRSMAFYVSHITPDL